MQTTVAKPVAFNGIGLHSGEPASLVVRPAPAGHGIVFRRMDLGGEDIAARFDAVVDTRLCTVLASPSGAKISTVEHVMAALAGLGVDNALIEATGPEVPIMDGSSEPFVAGLVAAGLRAQSAPRQAIRILRPVTVEEEGKKATLAPARRFEMRFSIDFEDEAIGRQSRTMTLVNGAFVDQLCRARTFGRLAEVEQLRSIGLARGGSLDNAIVVDGARVLNDGGLRYSDEFVRHKMLDAVGDLALAGAPIIGRYLGVCAGHGLTNTLLRALFADPTSYCWITQDPTARPSSLGHVAPLAAA